MSREVKVCGSCGEPIYWLKNEATGKPAPIEVKQSDIGNVIVNLEQGTYGILPAHLRQEYHEVHRDWLHLNHFATCSQARTWAKAGRAS